MVRLQLPNSAIASLLQSLRPAGRVAELGSLGIMTPLELTTALWREAARDLEFTFVTPFTLPDDHDTLSYLGLVAEFGSELGTLIISDEEPFDVERQSRFCRVATEHGYGYSCMSLISEPEPYDREGFIQLLTEWSWAGAPERTPSWYAAPSNDENEA